MNPKNPLCYNCKKEISSDDRNCAYCDSPILFNMLDSSLMDFMTEGTHPNLTPRSDNG